MATESCLILLLYFLEPAILNSLLDSTITSMLGDKAYNVTFSLYVSLGLTGMLSSSNIIFKDHFYCRESRGVLTCLTTQTQSTSKSTVLNINPKAGGLEGAASLM